MTCLTTVGVPEGWASLLGALVPLVAGIIASTVAHRNRAARVSTSTASDEPQGENQ